MGLQSQNQRKIMTVGYSGKTEQHLHLELNQVRVLYQATVAVPSLSRLAPFTSWTAPQSGNLPFFQEEERKIELERVKDAKFVRVESLAIFDRAQMLFMAATISNFPCRFF